MFIKLYNRLFEIKDGHSLLVNYKTMIASRAFPEQIKQINKVYCRPERY